MTEWRVSSVERSGSTWLRSLITNATSEHGGYAQPYQHAPPEPGQDIIFPTRNPYAWLDSMKRWVGWDDKQQMRRYLFYWAAGHTLRDEYPGSVHVRWEDFLHDYQSTVDYLAEELGIPGLRECKKPGAVSEDRKVHSDGFNASYYLDHDYLANIENALPDIQRILEKTPRTLERFGYQPEPGANL